MDGGLACIYFSGKQKGKQRGPSTLRFRKSRKPATSRATTAIAASAGRLPSELEEAALLAPAAASPEMLNGTMYIQGYGSLWVRGAFRLGATLPNLRTISTSPLTSVTAINSRETPTSTPWYEGGAGR